MNLVRLIAQKLRTYVLFVLFKFIFYMKLQVVVGIVSFYLVYINKDDRTGLIFADTFLRLLCSRGTEFDET